MRTERWLGGDAGFEWCHLCVELANEIFDATAHIVYVAVLNTKQRPGTCASAPGEPDQCATMSCADGGTTRSGVLTKKAVLYDLI